MILFGGVEGDGSSQTNNLRFSVLWRENTRAVWNRFNRHLAAVHCLILIIFSASLFLPMIGRGFVLDDFGHVFVVQHESLRFGLTHAAGAPYYAPLAWLSFKLDWLLWGLRPYMWAVTNLSLHIINTLLLYALASRIWRSRYAGFWSALGFALLFPATATAMLFISARAHLIAMLFYLVTLNFALFFIRSEGLSPAYAIGTVMAGTLAMFSKESGATVVAAVAIVIVYERLTQGRKKSAFAVTSVIVGLFLGLASYLALRSQSEATPFSFHGPICCSYAPSFRVLVFNVIAYGIRTYGLLAVLGLAILISFIISRRRIDVSSLSKYDFLLSFALFATAVAPFLLLRSVQGMYSYLPGIGASLMLGLLVRLFEGGQPRPPVFSRLFALAPILLVVVVYVGLTVKYSLKWIQLAEVNASVLKQIKKQQPTVPSNTFVRLDYSEVDLRNRFPEGFGDWCFPYAMRVLYGDRTLDGAIVRDGEPELKHNKPTEVRFSYFSANQPRVSKTAELSTR